MPRRDAVAKAATPNPRAANWLLAVPVFGSCLPFERPDPAGCCPKACEPFKALEVEALALSLIDALTETLSEAESLAVPEFDTLPGPLLVLAEWKPPPGVGVLLALADAD